MKSRFIELVCVLLIGLVASSRDDSVFGNETSPPVEDVVCGPRCVQFVLREHGIEAELIELIKEIQWPDLESGTTLDRVNAALKQRGLNTELVNVPNDSVYVWPHPAIVHVPDPKGELGHFAVLLPSNNTHEVTLWLGVGGVAKKTPAEFHKMHSGVALITMKLPVADGMVPFVRNRNVLWCSLTGRASAHFRGFG